MTQFLVDAYPTAPAVSSRKDGNELAEKAGGETGGEEEADKTSADSTQLATAAALAKSARPEELATVMDVMGAACRNRLVQEEFVTLGGLDAVANALAASLTVPASRNNASSNPTEKPEKSEIVSITVVRAAVELIEVIILFRAIESFALLHLLRSRTPSIKRRKRPRRRAARSRMNPRKRFCCCSLRRFTACKKTFVLCGLQATHFAYYASTHRETACYRSCLR